MTTPRLPLPSITDTYNSISNGNGLESDKIANSESLSALFSYFKEWSVRDLSLRFDPRSVISEPITAQSVIGMVE